MTKLLVSVRSAREARRAVQGGAALVDVKEPRNGSLGAASRRVWREVLDELRGRVPASAALGELATDPMKPQAADGFALAKIGLAGCRWRPDWAALWAARIAELPGGVEAVAVAYADHAAAGAPEPAEVLCRGIEIGCRAILFDTFDKSAGSLFDYLDDVELARLIREARQSALLVVLAGSIGSHNAARAVAFAPDFLAVRGAVCRGGRTSSVDQQLVAALARRLSARAAERSHDHYEIELPSAG